MTNLFDRLDNLTNLKTIMSFVVGSLIDEKELNKEDEGTNISDYYTEFLSNDLEINETKYEINCLNNIYEKLAHEERLRDMKYNMTPIFGCYVYLWTIQKLSYNEISEKMCNSLYEGNFVRNMLKVHNICEEWKNVCEIYQKPQFTNVIQEIQKEIIRDIVVVDSLYIVS